MTGETCVQKVSATAFLLLLLLLVVVAARVAAPAAAAAAAAAAVGIDSLRTYRYSCLRCEWIKTVVF